MSDGNWWDPQPGLPNDSEVLFFALLSVQTASSAAHSAKWAADVLRTAAAGSGESCLMRKASRQTGKLLDCAPCDITLHDVYSR